MARPGRGTISVSIDGPRLGFTDVIEGALREANRQALRAVGEALLQDTPGFTPILTGDLLRSGRVEELRNPFEGGNDAVRIVFGDSDIAYAEYQHEEELNHPSLGFFGRAEYLRRPLELNGRFYVELYRFEMRRALGV